MVTGVGLDAAASCAAIRCGLTNFVETRFMDGGGEWLIGSPVPLAEPWRGRAKLVQLVVPAIRECLFGVKATPTEKIPLLLCVAETDRPGRLEGLDDKFLDEVQAELGIRFHTKSAVIPGGRAGGVKALQLARRLIYEERERVPFCLVVGVDSLLVAPTLAAFEEKDRLLTSKNSNGFIPGEAGAAVLLGPVDESAVSQLLCLGIGFGKEKASIESEEPLRADGMAEAFFAAFADGGRTMADVEYRIADLNGEQYYFKEATLAMSRVLRERKERFDIWHPADCIGEVGAAIVPCVLGVALTAAQKGYSQGEGILCHFANDNGERAAVVLSYEAVQARKAA